MENNTALRPRDRAREVAPTMSVNDLPLFLLVQLPHQVRLVFVFGQGVGR